MSASLVGSEMCIRDRGPTSHPPPACSPGAPLTSARRSMRYTHSFGVPVGVSSHRRLQQAARQPRPAAQVQGGGRPGAEPTPQGSSPR
eukprot:9069628-Alexandrium_andersonii.AAC.1